MPKQSPLAGETDELPVTFAAACELARAILAKNAAVPVRMKILLDRLMANLPSNEVRAIIESAGWKHEDYIRGYRSLVSFFNLCCLYFTVFWCGSKTVLVVG